METSCFFAVPTKHCICAFCVCDVKDMEQILTLPETQIKQNLPRYMESFLAKLTEFSHFETFHYSVI